MGHHLKHRHIIGYARKKKPGPGYFHLRKNSILFFGMFLGGLLFSSLYSARDSAGSGLIITLVTNHIQVQALSGYWQILSSCLTKNLGAIVFLYFAANCIQGKWLIPLVPMFCGLSAGAITTSLLYQHRLGAMAYVLVCVLIPKFLQLILLLAVCNQAYKLSLGIPSQKPAGERLFLLFGCGGIVVSLLEALLLNRFTGLLTYL